MKKITILLLGGGLVAAAAVFVRPHGTTPTVPRVETSNEPAAAEVRSRTPVAVRPEIIEPILVLPEVETAPLPVGVLVPDLDVAIGRVGEVNDAPRPEVGRENRPWMSYAPEDSELADTRRLEWVKLSIRDAESLPRVGVFEETQEPPLAERASPKR